MSARGSEARTPEPPQPRRVEGLEPGDGENLEQEIARGTFEFTPFVVILIAVGVIGVIVLAISAVLWAIVFS